MAAYDNARATVSPGLVNPPRSGPWSEPGAVSPCSLRRSSTVITLAPPCPVSAAVCPLNDALLGERGDCGDLQQGAPAPGAEWTLNSLQGVNAFL